MMAAKTFPLGFMAAFLASAASARNTRFHQFFPVYNAIFTDIRDHQCAALYAAQQAAETSIWDSLCPEVLNCILENTSEAIKGNMASGTVALGLMPTILTFLGSSPAETALLSRRRPLLSFLIACGSPAVNPLPTFVYEDPVAKLKAREGRLLPGYLSVLSRFHATAIVFVEYLLILGAIANVITASYYTGLWTINTISCDTIYLPILWVALTVFIHIGGMLALALRAETIRDAGSRRSVKTWFIERIQYELKPCVTHDKLALNWKDENYFFIFISWCTSFGTVTHLLFGTIAFSSLEFIGKSIGRIILERQETYERFQGYVDSIKIIGRFMASAVVCRAVLMFELAGMRNALFKKPEYQPEDIGIK
jgi:hypothetical protein